MNAERLHAIALALRDELSSGEIPEQLERLAQGLKQAVAAPSQPSHQQEVSDSRSHLNEALRSAPSNTFSPAWKSAIEDLELDGLLGQALRERIEEIFLRNEITPSAAANEIAPLSAEVGRLSEALQRLLHGFEYLEIGFEELPPGEFEIGFLIPRDAVGEDLERLGLEFRKLDRVLAPFLELGTGGRPDLRVRTIASSEFQVFLQSAPAVAVLLATAMERIISSYEKVMNIRLAYKKLQDSDVSATALKAVAKDADAKMASEIKKVVEDLLKQADRKDDARLNELRKELTDSLNALANRVDKGYSVEVRAGPQEEPPADADEPPADAAARAAATAISSKQERLRFVNRSGETILRLPEGKADADNGTRQGPPPSTKDAARRSSRK